MPACAHAQARSMHRRGCRCAPRSIRCCCALRAFQRCVRCCRSRAQASLRALICCECVHALICRACVRVRTHSYVASECACARTHTLRACARARSVVSSQAGRDEMVSYEGSRHIIILRGKARRLPCTRMGMRRLRPQPAAQLQEMHRRTKQRPSSEQGSYLRSTCAYWSVRQSPTAAAVHPTSTPQYPQYPHTIHSTLRTLSTPPYPQSSLSHVHAGAVPRCCHSDRCSHGSAGATVRLHLHVQHGTVAHAAAKHRVCDGQHSLRALELRKVVQRIRRILD